MTATDGITKSLAKQRIHFELHKAAETLRDQLARDDWAVAPRAEFDKLVGDIGRWRFKVGGSK